MDMHPASAMGKSDGRMRLLATSPISEAGAERYVSENGKYESRVIV